MDLELRRSSYLRSPNSAVAVLSGLQIQMKQPHFTSREWRSGEKLLRSSRTMLKHIAPQEFLLLGEIRARLIETNVRADVLFR
jgi:hypothetical protein